MTSREAAMLRAQERPTSGSFTVAEAARRLGVCDRTIRRRVRAGTLRAYDVAGEGARRRALRIPVEEIDRLLVVTPREVAESVPVRPPRPTAPKGGFRARPRRAA